LTGSEYSERRAQCEEGTHILSGFYPGVQALRDVDLEQLESHKADLPNLVYRRCRFIIEENQRVLDIADALTVGDRGRISSLTVASYAGARDLYEISCDEMEMMMAAMLSAPGVIGARQAGAGFGGCMVACVERGKVDAFARHVREHYQASSGLEPPVYPVQAAPGAGTLPW
jgi:galactokinase